MSFETPTSRKPPRTKLLKLALVSCAASLVLISCSQQQPLGYLSLGDSLAAGVGSSEPARKSYAALYREELQESTKREVRFRQLGLSGETAQSFIGDYPEGESQLVRAKEFLRRHPGSRVTLSLGGNDLLRTAGDSARERREAISEYGDDLDFILKTLNRASDPPPRITVLTLYNPDPTGFSERWAETINEEIRSTARHNGAEVAEAHRAFEGHTGEYLRRYASGERDIHPNDRGYATLAQTVREASGPPEAGSEDKTRRDIE